jgi:hypothetical protein
MFSLNVNNKCVVTVVGYEVLITVAMKTTFFWDIALCSLLKANGRFGEHQGRP